MVSVKCGSTINRGEIGGDVYVGHIVHIYAALNRHIARMRYVNAPLDISVFQGIADSWQVAGNGSHKPSAPVKSSESCVTHESDPFIKDHIQRIDGSVPI